MTITYATVTSVTPLRVRFNYELEQSDTQYTKLLSYTPKIGDSVAIIKDSKGKYLILGAV